MAGLDDLSRGELADILRRLRVLETASPLQNASIGSNGLRVYDGGVITIQNGGLNVTGTATITGTLQADGTIAFTGTLTQSGPSTFTGDTKLNGPTHINGATDIKGSLSVEGASTLKGNLSVTGSGKITAGNTVIDPSASNGGVTFASGGGVGGNGGNVVVKGTGNAGLITDTTAAVFAGASQLTVGDGYVKIDGLETVSGVTANLYMDPSTKRIKRIV
jgi:hypothetical protein